MTGILLRVAEPTGRYRRNLRRFRSSTDGSCQAGGYCDATIMIGEVDQVKAERIHGDNWPHDDPRWPKTCAKCSYEFTDVPWDQWQRNDNEVYRLQDGTEFTLWGGAAEAPPGTMVRADWYDRAGSGGRGESWLVVLPDGGTWITTQNASDGGYWTVTGTPPAITASPSIFHNPPHGWHGFIRNGELVPA